MTFTLSDVKGLGPSSVKDLDSHGIKTVNDLAHASIADVSAIPGFGNVRAERVIKAATGLLGSEAAMPDAKTTTDQPARKTLANKQPTSEESTGGTESKTEKPKDKKKDKKKKSDKDKKKKKGKKSKKSKK